MIRSNRWIFAHSRSFSILLQDRQAALVVGAGDATGGAIARKFAQEGYIVCPVRRNAEKLAPLVNTIEKEGGRVVPFGCDCRNEEQVVQLVDTIEKDIGPIAVTVFNVGGNIRFSILEMTSKKYYKTWEMACFSGFLVGRQVALRMVPRKHGTIIFTGATASIRGGSGFSAFAGAKHALRALAQSMSRELGPLGIHVAHVLIDGAIDTKWIHEILPDAAERSAIDGLLEPQDIAENYVHLHNQPKNSWTFEMDLRPWNEKW